MARKKLKFHELENEIQPNTTQKKIVLENVQDINDTCRNDSRPIFVEPTPNPTTSKWLVISLAIFAAGVLTLLVIVNSGLKQNTVQKAANNSSKNSNIVSPATPQDNSHFIVNKIDTNPSGATVFIDDQQRGRTPLYNVSLDEGPHNIRFEKSGYKTDWDVILDGQTAFVPLMLEMDR